jgi:ABC-2 type transport system ATP-binding protein
MAALDIADLHRSFGERKVIDGLGLHVPEHSIFGFIGPNGAGKTTTMKMILGLLKPDSGTIEVCGEKASYGETRTNRFIGYLPDVPEFYGYMDPREYLRLCGRITGMPKQRIDARTNELLELVGLDGATQKIAGFSRGMKQRLGIAQALLNEPRLLLCDEPTSALDPVGRKEILGILAKIRDTTTVVFSTHVLSDVERICDRIAVLDQGKIVLSGLLDDIKASRSRPGYLIEFALEADLACYREAWLKGHDAASVTCTGLDAHIASADGVELIGLFAQLEIAPLRFEALESSLEDLFMEVVK